MYLLHRRYLGVPLETAISIGTTNKLESFLIVLVATFLLSLHMAVSSDGTRIAHDRWELNLY